MLQDHVASGERQLKDFSKFLKSHENTLDTLLAKSFCMYGNYDELHKQNTRIDVKPAKVKFITRLKNSSKVMIDFAHGREEIHTMDLIKSPNMCLNKTIAVFVELCMEVRQLNKEGQKLLIENLFGDEHLCEILNEEEEEVARRLDANIQSNEDGIVGVNVSPRILAKISDMLEMLFQTKQFVERCFVLISEIIRQFAALFETENSNYINVNHSSLHLQTVFNCLADATCMIIKFDCIFENSQLKSIWPHYKNANRINDGKRNSHKLSESDPISCDGIYGLRNVYCKIDHLISGNLFANLIDSTFKAKGQTTVKAFTQFSAQFLSYLRNTLNIVQSANSNGPGLGAVTQLLQTGMTATSEQAHDILLNVIDEMVSDPSKLFLKLNAMCILYHHLFGNLDQRLFSSIIDNTTKFPCIFLVENKIWSPEHFLNRFAETLVMKTRGACDKLSSITIQKLQQQWLLAKCQRLQKDLQLYTAQIMAWIMKIRNEFGEANTVPNNQHNLKIDELSQQIILLLQGIAFLERLSSDVNMITNLHVYLNCPMTKQNILSICKLIELLQMIKHTMDDLAHKVFYTTQCMSQYQLYQAMLIVANAKKKYQMDSSAANIYNERAVDILSALDLAQMALSGPPNIKRMLIARLALTLADPKQLFQMDQLNKICRLFASIEYLIQIHDIVQNLASMSLMYWHHDALLSIQLRHNIDGCEASDIEKISYLLDAVTDCHSEILADYAPPECSTKFAKGVSSIVNELVIAKLCGYIETRLRLDVHMNLQILPVTDFDPFASQNTRAQQLPISDMRRMLALKPFPVLDACIDNGSVDRHLCIQDHVSSYLSQMFYNLTTISMYDWRTYGQMRFLATQKFRLNTIEDYLPTQTLEQGLDVLEIMRNIHSFVSNYLYNLNNQMFIEKNSKNKHLNAINIRHIANSLRTHGIGIINTTVNFTYQFLHKKLYIFSQYLYNENIQSRLMKELKSFRETNVEKSEEEQVYNFERASNFIKSIRHLGLSRTNQSSLDLFQELITHIGNAMGYVRMMRSGGIHCCANASIFLPIVDRELRFQELCEKNQMSAETINAAKNLESDVTYLRHNNTGATDYFRLLVDAFSSFFQSSKNPHLKLFYLIVPALTLNYIECIVMAKDKMNKKTKQQGTWFTDDGFAMGLAYVLKLLNQKTEFSSLHWFKAVRQKLNSELEQLGKASEDNFNGNESTNKTYDAKLQQTIALSERRINIILQEFDLLYCSLNSAKNFYQ